MNFKQSFSLAIKSLATSKMRSFLTMLGIIIGVASVIILVSMVDGLKASIVEQFESMGTNLISVSINSRGSTRTVTPEQMQELVEENPDLLAGVSPMTSINGATVRVGTDDSDTTSVTGVSESYGDMAKKVVVNGRFLQYMDIESRQKNCVIGSYIAEHFFDGEDPIGEKLKINGNTFTIVGVLEEKADSEESSSDDAVYIPYTAVRSITRNEFVGTYMFQAADKELTDQAKKAITDYLYSIFNSSDSYMAMSQAEMLEMVDDITGQITVILVGIAAISLLVGGIGIMNIMLVSVTERTREIGIRKSLGAKRWDIMSQFVVEAATTSSVGGVNGIILGILLSYAASTLLQIPPVISLPAVLVAFSVSAIIGVTFGYFPASKASKLNPIEALRHD